MDKDLKNYKTTICWHFQNKGYCSLAHQCYFAHGAHQIRSKIDPIHREIQPQLKPFSIYKTQLCKYFMKGYCRNDDQCPFAHGAADLHSMLVVSTQPLKSQQFVPPPLPPKPDYGQAGQFLFSILRNLEQVFPGEVQKKVLIKKGFELIQSGDLPQANEIINELVNSNTLSQKQKDESQTILSNAYSLHKINFMHY